MEGRWCAKVATAQREKANQRRSSPNQEHSSRGGAGRRKQQQFKWTKEEIEAIERLGSEDKTWDERTREFNDRFYNEGRERSRDSLIGGYRYHVLSKGK